MIRIGDRIVCREDIRVIDMTHLDELRVRVHLAEPGEPVELRDAQAVDLLMRICPSVFEGPRLRFARHAWAVHNLIGHPVMQICAWLGKPKLGLWVHDVTVPTPLGR